MPARWASTGSLANHISTDYRTGFSPTHLPARITSQDSIRLHRKREQAGRSPGSSRPPALQHKRLVHRHLRNPGLPDNSHFPCSRPRCRPWGNPRTCRRRSPVCPGWIHRHSRPTRPFPPPKRRQPPHRGSDSWIEAASYVSSYKLPSILQQALLHESRLVPGLSLHTIDPGRRFKKKSHPDCRVRKRL